MGKVLHVPAMPVHLLTLKSNTCPPSSSVSCCSAMLSRGHGKAHALTLISLCHHLFFPSPSSGCSNDLRFYHHDVAENNGRFLIYGTLTRRAMIRCHCIHDPFTTDDHRQFLTTSFHQLIRTHLKKFIYRLGTSSNNDFGR